MNESPSENLTFEQALGELERVVRDLEEGEIGLEDSLARYECGVNLLKRCFAQLKEAEQRILLLNGEDADGKPVLQPFEHAATADLAKSDGRRSRKKAGEP